MGMPLVFVGMRAHRHGDCVDLDYAAGFREAARHLAQLGHRKIGFVCGLPERRSYRLRKRLYGDALAMAGLRFSIFAVPGMRAVLCWCDERGEGSPGTIRWFEALAIMAVNESAGDRCDTGGPGAGPGGTARSR